MKLSNPMSLDNCCKKGIFQHAFSKMEVECADVKSIGANISDHMQTISASIR